MPIANVVLVAALNGLKGFGRVKERVCVAGQQAIQAEKAVTAYAGGVSHRYDLTPFRKARRADTDFDCTHCCIGPPGLWFSQVPGPDGPGKGYVGPFGPES